MSGFSCKCGGTAFVLEQTVTVDKDTKLPTLTDPGNQLRCLRCSRIFDAATLAEKEKK